MPCLRLSWYPPDRGKVTLLFTAELGNKTQLAAISMTAKHNTPLWVFTGATLALAAVTLLGVLGGELLIRFISEKVLQDRRRAIRGHGVIDVV